MNALHFPRVVIRDLIQDPCLKTTTARAEPVEACASLNVGGASGKPGLAPAGEVLFFASPKKRTQKKGDPMVRVPSLRCGQPAVLAENGVELELATLRQSLALIRFRLCSLAQPDGWGDEYECGEAGSRKARPRRSPIANPIPNPLPHPPPFCMRRGAEVQTDQGERLSEPKASSSSTPAGPSTAGCPRSASEGGRRQQGRLFLCLLSFWRRKKKVSCRRATPGLPHQPPPSRVSTVHQTPAFAGGEK